MRKYVQSREVHIHACTKFESYIYMSYQVNAFKITKKFLFFLVGIQSIEKVQKCNYSVLCDLLLPPIFPILSRTGHLLSFNLICLKWKVMFLVPTPIKALSMNGANSKFLSVILRINYIK